jgi:single-strand DNA-binding protein
MIREPPDMNFRRQRQRTGPKVLTTTPSSIVAILCLLLMVSSLQVTPIDGFILPGFRPHRDIFSIKNTPGDFFDEISENSSSDSAPRIEQGQHTGERPSDEELAAAAGEWDNRLARFNRVALTGRVGNDPDPKYFDDGKVVLNLSLAVRRKYHGAERKAFDIKTGEEETDWYGLEIWGRDAEYAAKYVTKGARIGVVGSLQVDEWSDRDTGEPRNAAKIIVKDLDILETKAESELRQSSRRGPSFYTYDNDSDDGDDGYSPAGTGGFFD